MSMIKKDLVSVVMPCFNSSDFIGRSIESVLNQTWDNIELIVVDDGSVDESCEIVREYISRDNRVKLIKNKYNQGAAFSRNVAIEAAHGRFIAFLDSDDVWHENKLDFQISVMKKERCAFSCTGYTMAKPNGNKKNIIPPKCVSEKELISGCDVGCLTAVLDVEMLGGKLYMRNIRMRQDMLLWVDAVRASDCGVGIPNVLATLYVRGGSLTSNKFSAAKYQWLTYRQELKFSFVKSAICFFRYAVHGFIKHKF